MSSRNSSRSTLVVSSVVGVGSAAAAWYLTKNAESTRIANLEKQLSELSGQKTSMEDDKGKLCTLLTEVTNSLMRIRKAQAQTDGATSSAEAQPTAESPPATHDPCALLRKVRETADSILKNMLAVNMQRQSASNTLNEKNEQLGELKKEMTTNRQCLHDKDTEIDRISTKLASTVADRKTLQQNLSKEKTAHKEITQRFNQVVFQMDSKDSEILALKGELKQEKARSKHVEQQSEKKIKELEAKVATIQDEAKKQQATAKSHASKLQAELETAKTALDKEKAAFACKVEGLETEIAKVRTELEASQKTAKSRLKMIEAMTQSKVAANQSQHDEFKLSMQEKLRQLESALASTSSELANKSKELAISKAELKASNAPTISPMSVSNLSTTPTQNGPMSHSQIQNDQEKQEKQTAKPVQLNKLPSMSDLSKDAGPGQKTPNTGKGQQGESPATGSKNSKRKNRRRNKKK